MALASELERGKFFEYKGEILQVIKKERVDVGTHSHSKLKFTAVNLSGKGERVLTFAHNDRVDFIDITKKIASVISKTPDSIQIMDSYSYETLDTSVEPSLHSEVNVGDEVKRGDTLLIYEAMKMENSLASEREGTVKSIKVNAGDSILQGDVLLEIE